MPVLLVNWSTTQSFLTVNKGPLFKSALFKEKYQYIWECPELLTRGRWDLTLGARQKVMSNLEF